ncbi:hypothetical protein [Sporomusa aerivorans]|uniref:hypothetical protein n=1 Tax=Sporomusa aerivorans TaxID=204936 RepID=UPI00352A3DE0
MKLGIAGPQEPGEKIIQIIKREFHQIEPVALTYRTYLEAPSLIAPQQPFLDVILFAGATPLSYAEKHIKQTIPWEFVPRSGSALLRVLLSIALLNKYDICRLSSDLYDTAQLYEAYEEIGINKDRLQIYTAKPLPQANDFADYVCAFHEQHYECNRVSCCITALSSVHERLTAKKIPCFRVDPTADVIRQTLHKLQLNYLLQVSQQSQIVAVYLRIDASHEYSLLNDNEYQYIIDKTNVTREIYLFAQRIQAAVIEVGLREFLLFSTKQMLENVTNNYEKIDLLPAVRKNTSSTLSAGVGYGKTAQEAKINAGIGMERAGKAGGDTAFIVYSGNQIIGPIRSYDINQPANTNPKIDQKFLAVSEKTGISVNTVFQIYSLVKQQGKNRFTTAELAELTGVTLRTMNRIVAKLTLHGFCCEVGKRVLANSGRPSRIIEICIP